mmetsp:Transcript_6113/g.12523  ORF Transcript_6113/g.12523 Transcript_6113/m.12523 type:complete len:210 (+) Transcript_6113:142-771(+)
MAACTLAAAFLTLCVASSLAFFESAFSSAAVASSMSFLAPSSSMSSTFSKSFTRMESWLESTLAKPPMTTRGFHWPACLKRSTPMSSAVIMGAWFASTPSWPLALGRTTSDTASVIPRPSGDNTLSCTRSDAEPEPSSALRAVGLLSDRASCRELPLAIPRNAAPLRCRSVTSAREQHNSGRSTVRAICTELENKRVAVKLPGTTGQLT